MLERFLPRIDFKDYDDFKTNYKVNVPENFNFAFDIVDEWAKLDPAKKALYWCDDKGSEDVELTFEDLRKLTNQAANYLKALGIKKGSPVLLLLKQRIEAWVCYLALHKIGAVCIPATFQLTPKDIVYRCNSASIEMIIAIDDDEMMQHIADSIPESPTLNNICIVGENIPNGWHDFRNEVKAHSTEMERPTGANATTNTDPMIMYFSSGTTGMPKMIFHDYTYPLGHIVTAKYWQQVEEDTLHLTMSDSGWAKFGWGKIYGQWICGATIVAYDNEKFSPQHLLQTIDRLPIRTFCAPPTIYRFLIKEDMSKCDFSSISHCAIAGEPLNPEVFNKFKEITGLEVHEGFGQSETSVIIANFGWDPIKPGSTGKPSPLYDVQLVDDDGNPCEDGDVGRIVIANASKDQPLGLFKKYYRDEEATNAAWHDGIYDTGDTAWRDSDGYLWFEGRSDDVIKCSGYRIGPFEVESAIITHPSVLECAVTAAPDPVRGQVVKATIVLTKGYTPSDELTKEIQTHVKNVTAPYKYPRIVEYVDELPKTLSGKIKRAHIRKTDAK